MLTKGMGKRTDSYSHHVLVFEVCSARPASNVLCWMLEAVVQQLSRGK